MKRSNAPRTGGAWDWLWSELERLLGSVEAARLRNGVSERTHQQYLADRRAKAIKELPALRSELVATVPGSARYRKLQRMIKNREAWAADKD